MADHSTCGDYVPAACGMKIDPILAIPNHDWLRMRIVLWPDTSAEEHLVEMARFMSDPVRFAQFIARSESNQALGFAEASLRSDHVIGTVTTPVAFLEGLYVEPHARRQGVARGLVEAVANWGRSRGCSELASDTQLDNLVSQSVHTRLGFLETERVVCFKMALD